MTRLLTVALMAVLAACATGSGGDDLIAGPDQVLLTVTSEGGFIPPEFNLERMPRYVLMGDGTLYYQGPTILIFPGPLLPNVGVVTLSPDRLADVLELVRELELPDIDEVIDDSGAQLVADADTTFVTYYDPEGGTHRIGVYALGMGDGPGSVTKVLVSELIQELDQAAGEGPPLDFVAERLQVAAGTALEFDPGMSVEKPWPLETSFTEMEDWGFGWRCTEVAGPQVADLMAIFAEANQATHWVDGEGAYSIKARPLLPGEVACAGGSS